MSQLLLGVALGAGGCPRPASAGTSPLDVSEAGSIAGWWKADEFNVGDGTGIQNWGDQSGKGLTLSQATSSARAKFYASQVGGKPALKFQNGIYSSFYPFGAGITLAATLTLFVVKTRSAAAAYMIGGDQSAAQPGFLDGWAGADQLAFYNNASENAPVAVPHTAFHLACFQVNASAVIGRVNGAGLYSAAPKGTISGKKLMYLGGANATPSNPMDAYIAELVIYTGATPLTLADIQGVEQFLAFKYSLTLS